MQFWALGPDYKPVDISVGTNILKESISSEGKSERALRTYLFVDKAKGDLVPYKFFHNLLDELPEGDRTRLKFREHRQAMCGVIRYYCNMTLQDQKDLHESLIPKLMANHSVLTGLETYAVNHFNMTSQWFGHDKLATACLGNVHIMAESG